MGNVIVFNTCHLARLTRNGPLPMHHVSHGTEAADLTHQFMRQRNQMAGQIAECAEACVFARKPP
jgi:hypothetical protein